MENKVNELIEELRRRVNNLSSYPEDSYLFGVANIAEWLFKLKEFKPAFEELDKKKIYQMKILEEVGNKLFEEIKKVWEVLKKYINKDVLLKLDDTQFVFAKERGRADFYLVNKNNDKNSEFRLLRLEQMIEGEEEYYVLDIYHELRLLIEQLYHSSHKNEIKKNNLVIFNGNGQISEFVSENIFQLFLFFRDTENEIEKENELSPIEAYDYLRQLLVLKEEEDWRWQLKEWQKVFGKDFYTPRLHILSDFLYDFIILGLKKKIDFASIKKLAIKVSFDHQETEDKLILFVFVGKKKEYGCIEFDKKKSTSSRFIAGEIIKLILRNENYTVSFNDLLHNIDIEGLLLNDVYRYIVYFNERFEKAYKEGKLKIFLHLSKKSKGRRENELELLAFPFSRIFFKEKISSETPNHIY